MAAHLNAIRVLLCAGLIVGLGSIPAIGMAERLVDPTRPHASLSAPVSPEAESANAGPRLQSILISAQRRVAIINGATVRVGDMFEDARVVRIAETEVILRAGNEVRILRMYPDLVKKSVMADVGARVNKHK